MTTPKQKLKALKLTIASSDGNSRGCEIESLPGSSRYADQIIRLGHTGWFTDDFCDEKYRGEVWELADDSERKESIYVAGYNENSGAYVCLSCTRGILDTFDCAEDAARAADSLAERNAETEREYQAKWQEASQCSDEIERMKRDARAVRGQWRINATHARDYGRDESYAEESRAEHAELIASIVAKRERIAELGMAGEF